MKKCISLLLCIAMLMAGSACAASDTDAAQSPPPANESGSALEPEGGQASASGTAAMSGREGTGTLSETTINSYYAAPSTPAWEYFQNNSIQKFAAGWVEEATHGEITEPQWDYDSFSEIVILTHDLELSRPDEQKYYCTFSDGADRYGYLIMIYDEDGGDPAMINWGVVETTPDRYDLRANLDEVMAGLAATDIDLATATASRVYLYDEENKRADQVVRFLDGKGDSYLYYFGEPSMGIEKIPA